MPVVPNVLENLEPGTSYKIIENKTKNTAIWSLSSVRTVLEIARKKEPWFLDHLFFHACYLIIVYISSFLQSWSCLLVFSRVCWDGGWQTLTSGETHLSSSRLLFVFDVSWGWVGGGGYRDEGNLVHVVSWVLTWFLKPPVSNFSKLLCIDISAQVMGMCVNEISGEWSCSFGAQYTNDFHMHQQVCVVFSAFTLLGKYALFVTSNFTPTR